MDSIYTLLLEELVSCMTHAKATRVLLRAYARHGTMPEDLTLAELSDLVFRALPEELELHLRGVEVEQLISNVACSLEMAGVSARLAAIVQSGVHSRIDERSLTPDFSMGAVDASLSHPPFERTSVAAPREIPTIMPPPLERSVSN
ncbi:MAG: hypothetical protein AAF550_14220 [Myxococcota bacterium]